MSMNMAELELPRPKRVAIVDDDNDDREGLAEDLQEADFEPVPILGQFGSDLDKLIGSISQAKADFVICDYRLQSTNFAAFSGASVVRKLRYNSIPAMLLTMYQSTNKLELRVVRDELPIVVSRIDFRSSELSRYASVCARELSGDPVESRRPHRVLIGVLGIVSGRGARTFEVEIPSWRPGEAILLPEDCVAEIERSKVAEGRYIMGDVNIDAIHEDELYFRNLNEVVGAAGERL
jgi:CheY-like chemotaxis protein